MRPGDKAQRSQVSLNATSEGYLQRTKHNSPPNVSIAAYTPEQRPLHSDAVYH